ncbi:MAG: hypothetical protein L0L61_06955, partial [Lactococcus sp.]|nr:hypothetical protein [Lactococcus sp.]
SWIVLSGFAMNVGSPGTDIKKWGKNAKVPNYDRINLKRICEIYKIFIDTFIWLDYIFCVIKII